MSYTQRTRKQITLPSGVTVTIRKLCARDFMEFGNIPDTLKTRKKAAEMTPQEIEWGKTITNIILTRCTSLRIVERPLSQCADGEISIDEVDQKDAEAIVYAVYEFSGVTKEVSQAAQKFPEKSETGSDPAPAGETLPRSTVSASESVNL